MTTESGAPGAERELPRPQPVGVTPPDGLLLALTTIGSREEAESIARTLLDERLVACANLLPGCRSLYLWQGALEEADETLVLFKTTRNRYRAFEERLRALHPYELPEIVALSPDAVLPAYAAWVIGETRRRLAR
jgi:periplasmic divalent cation tolerance protein